MKIEELGAESISFLILRASFRQPKYLTSKSIRHGRAQTGTSSITGGETDVCVLATMLGAIDWGFRVILITDALCSSADVTHDAMMDIYLHRFGEQVETVKTDTLFASWLGASRRERTA